MARSFNGSSDKIVAASASPLNINAFTTAFSVSAWVNQTSNSATPTTIIGNLDSANDFIGWEFSTVQSSGTSNVIQFAAFHANSAVNLFALKSTITYTNSSGWHNFGFSYTGNGSTTGITLYLDGVADSGTVVQNALTAGTVSTVVPSMGVRNSNGTDFFPGSLADVSVWLTTLTAGQFKSLSLGARPVNVNSANLIAWYPLDGLQSPEPDFSGNANNGTLTGTANAPGPPVMQLTPPPLLILPKVVAAGQTFQPAWAMRNRIVVEGIGI